MRFLLSLIILYLRAYFISADEILQLIQGHDPNILVAMRPKFGLNERLMMNRGVRGEWNWKDLTYREIKKFPDPETDVADHFPSEISHVEVRRGPNCSNYTDFATITTGGVGSNSVDIEFRLLEDELEEFERCIYQVLIRCVRPEINKGEIQPLILGDSTNILIARDKWALEERLEVNRTVSGRRTLKYFYTTKKTKRFPEPKIYKAKELISEITTIEIHSNEYCPYRDFATIKEGGIRYDYVKIQFVLVEDEVEEDECIYHVLIRCAKLIINLDPPPGTQNATRNSASRWGPTAPTTIVEQASQEPSQVSTLYNGNPEAKTQNAPRDSDVGSDSLAPPTIVEQGSERAEGPFKLPSLF